MIDQETNIRDNFTDNSEIAGNADEKTTVTKYFPLVVPGRVLQSRIPEMSSLRTDAMDAPS